MPPTYLIVMALYTVLTAFILYLVISNMLRSRDIWDKIMAVFVIVPLFMRLIFIK
jgi:high-affinity Fe2+/Pb2+ permease